MLTPFLQYHVLKEILERTGYELDVTVGQRKYGGPPPGDDGSQPGSGQEVRHNIQCLITNIH